MLIISAFFMLNMLAINCTDGIVQNPILQDLHVIVMSQKFSPDIKTDPSFWPTELIKLLAVL